jgi:hypothetical protein
LLRKTEFSKSPLSGSRLIHISSQKYGFACVALTEDQGEDDQEGEEAEVED